MNELINESSVPRMTDPPSKTLQNFLGLLVSTLNKCESLSIQISPCKISQLWSLAQISNDQNSQAHITTLIAGKS